MGKKSREVMAKAPARCSRPAAWTPATDATLGVQSFDVIERFADYVFNKSHTFGYGLVTYQTAYLKAYYPVEYVACLLTSVKSNLDKAAVYLADVCGAGHQGAHARRQPQRHRLRRDRAPKEDVPIDVDLPPGSPGAITFGLSAVRNVGEGLVTQLLAERDANGPFTSFHDFAERVPEQVLNKRTVESLIKAGAFDNLNHPRRGLLMVFEQIIDTTLVRRRERDQGVMSLFGDDVFASEDGGFSERVAIPEHEFDKSDRLKFEKEMLGLYVSDHPLLGAEAALRRKVDCPVAEALDRDDGSMFTIGGVITGLTRKFTKKGDQMAVFTLEDLGGAVEVTVFPRTLMEHGHKLLDDQIVTVKGRLDKRDESRVGFMAQDIQVVEHLDGGDAAHAAPQAAGHVAQRAAHPPTAQDSARPPGRVASRAAHRQRQDGPRRRRLPRPTSTWSSASCSLPSATTP